MAQAKKSRTQRRRARKKSPLQALLNQRGAARLSKKITLKSPRALLVVVGVVIVGIAVVAFSSAASASPEIKSGLANKCVDDYQSSTANGNKVDSFTCNGSGAQHWTLKSNGTVQVFGKCLDVYGAKTGNGTKIDLWPCNGGRNQQWRYNAANHALVGLQSGKCLDVPNASSLNGVQLQIWQCLNNVQQHWYFTSFIPTPSPTPATTPKPSVSVTPAATPVTTSTPKPTTTPVPTSQPTPTPVASSSAPAIPTAVPSGFTRAFTEDFNTPAALGSFDSVYGGSFDEYTGCCSTNGFTQYSSSKVLSVQNGSLFYKLHTEGSTSYAAAPQPWSEKSFLYGQYGLSVKLDSSNGPGYKIAFLLWPETGQWTNEVDFPEVDPDFTAPVRAVSLNTTTASGSHTFCGPLNTGYYLSDGKYHTFLLSWTPGSMTASIDGKVVENFPASCIPSQAMRLSLQAEGWINQGSIPSSTTDVLEVPWVYINTYN